MEGANVRKGVTNARFNEQNVRTLSTEVLIISAAAGFLSGSWVVFGGVFLGSIILLFIKPLALILCILLSLGWGYIGVSGIQKEPNLAMAVLYKNDRRRS